MSDAVYIALWASTMQQPSEAACQTDAQCWVMAGVMLVMLSVIAVILGAIVRDIWRDRSGW